ncbi:MAG: TerC family protein [Actinomycetes bacterium]
MSRSIWLITSLALAVVFIFDFAIAYFNRNRKTSLRAATLWTLFYVSLAIGFGWSLGLWSTHLARTSFFAGWITEYSLSFDNLFVFILILARLKIAEEKEELVLMVGIVLSLFLRGGFIAAGSAVINRWSSVFFLFGGFLIYTAFQLIKDAEEEEWKEGRLLSSLRKRGMSNFTVALVAIATANVLFAFDSIPAIFGLTKDPYIVVTANVFALMGLRQLYFLIGGLMKKLIYLSEGLAIILGFIGVKLIIEAAHHQGWNHVGKVKIPEITLQVSLGVIISVLAITTVMSLLKSREVS